MKSMKKTKKNPYVIDSSLKFKITESYKAIRTNLAYSLIKKGCRKIIISSSCPSEGKSTMAVNVAVSIAQTEAKVLLIDADLRRPKVHRFLALNNAPGVTNYLSDMNTLDEVIRQTQYPNLQVITAGSLVPNPSEMLSSELFKDLLKDMEKKYNYIIIDSTPLNVVADALPLIKISDGVVIVVREKVSTYTEVDAAIKQLKMIDAKILGFIYNGAANKGHHYYTTYKKNKYEKYN